MFKYTLIHNQLPDITSMQFPRKCRKVQKGFFEYTIDSNFNLILDNKGLGTSSTDINLQNIIPNLTARSETSAQRFLGTAWQSGDNNNVGFICAVLRDLGNISIT